MSYPLINGASINSSGGASEAPLVPTRGIPMALSGTQTAVRVLLVPSADALKLGAHRTQRPLRPPSLALAQAGVPTAKFQATLYPAPLQMAVEGQAHLVLTVFPEPADALALGAAKVKTGTDVELKPWGLGMCVAGQATVTQAQPQPSVTYQVPAARAMRYGAAAIELPSIVLRPQGSDALRMGRARLALLQGAVLFLALGQLQLCLVDGLGAIQALGQPHLRPMQRALVEGDALAEQLTLGLRHADVQPAVYDIGYQRHLCGLQLGLGAQQLGPRSLGMGFAGPKQAQIPDHVDAGMKVGVDGCNILQGADIAIELRPVGCIGHALQQALLAQAAAGLGQAQVLRQGLLYQGVELGLVPAAPPGGQVAGAQSCGAGRALSAGVCGLLPARRRRAVQHRLGRRGAAAKHEQCKAGQGAKGRGSHSGAGSEWANMAVGRRC